MRDVDFNPIDDFVRGAANGATFGLADVFAGTMDTLIHGGSLGSNIRKELDRSEYLRREDILAYGSGLITGAMMTGEIVSHELSGKGMWKSFFAGYDEDALARAGMRVPRSIHVLGMQGIKSAYTMLGSGTAAIALPQLEIIGGKGFTSDGM